MKSPLVSIADIAEQIRGVTYAAAEAVLGPRTGHVPILRANNITPLGLTFDDLVYVPAARVSNSQKLRPGDVLLVASSGSRQVVGRAGTVRCEFEGSFGAFCKVLRPRDGVDHSYFAHFFQTRKYRETISSQAAGIGIVNLRAEHLNQLRIPLPPLQEQRRIAALLDRADEVRRMRRAATVLLNQLPQVIFFDMFGDGDANPQRFPVHPLQTLCRRVTDGTHQAPKWSTAGVPFLFVSNIRDRVIDFDTDKYVSLETYCELTKNCPIEVGDVLYTAVGSYGNAAAVRDGRKFAFQRHVAQIKPNFECLDSTFLEVALESDYLRRQADKVAKGVAQKTVTLGDLKTFRIVCPPLPLQRRFAARIQRADELRGLSENHARKLDELFASMQDSVFFQNGVVGEGKPAISQERDECLSSLS